MIVFPKYANGMTREVNYSYQYILIKHFNGVVIYVISPRMGPK